MNLSPSQIPASITTVEQLHAWSGMLLHRGNSTLKNTEAENFSDFTCQVSIFQANDGTQRLIVRMNLELEPTYAASGAKLWTQVKKYSDMAIPTAYAA